MFLCYGTSADMSYFGWENEALPLGNSKIGAKIFGGADCELITFNEKTLWSGGKDVPGFNYGISNPDGGKAIHEIQQLLFDGNEKSATAAMKKLQGNNTGFGAYQVFGNLYLNFGKGEAADKYVRDLDLDSASAMVTYKKGKATFTRHYFTSYPDNVFVGRIETDSEENTFSLDAYFISEQKGISKAKDNSITCEGTVNANIGTDAKPGKDKNSMKYACEFRFILKNGTSEATPDGHILIKDCSSFVVVASFATDYANNFPVFCDGSDPMQKVHAFVDSAAEKSFGELYRTHLADYRELYDRVKFSLGEPESGQTTDNMLKRFGKRGEYKRNLITTLFQYGRYLLISSSRDGSLPANLQGVWNGKNDPPWESDYHFNINAQMNYWPAFSANLKETAKPYIDFVNSLKKPGRIVANKTMGIGQNKPDGTPDFEKPTGWVIHTTVSPLGMVAPGYNWRWGWAPVNGAWATYQMFEYYLFTKDIDTLRDEIYPTMQEASLLWSQLLVEDKKSSRLVVSPCFSPEHGPVSSGGTYEQSCVYALFDATIKAAKDLKEAGFEDSIDEKLIEKIKAQIERLKPYSVGKWGQILEWEKEDTFFKRGFYSKGVQKHHRHISHLLGLYPFSIIKKEDHVLEKGAKISIADRGLKTTGWALSHRLLCCARLRDGEKCDQIIEQTMKKMILKNLFGNHPPFQIDCNFGFTAGVCEMLLQSHEDFVRILPALPSEWHMGEIQGLMARGNFEFSLNWKDGKLKEGTVKSNLGGKCRLCYDGKIMLVTDENGNEIDVDYDDKGITSFDTVKGATYKFS